jgi:hypothetical protein
MVTESTESRRLVSHVALMPALNDKPRKSWELSPPSKEPWEAATSFFQRSGLIVSNADVVDPPSI